MKVHFSRESLLQYLVQHKEHFVYGCASVRKDLPKDKKGPLKVTFRPVLMKGKYTYLLEFHEKTSSKTAHFPLEEAIHLLLQQYQELFLRFEEEEYQLQVHEATISGKRYCLEKKREQKLSHNLQKNYILQDGIPIQFLIELGLMSREGRVLPHAQDKFRQINRFLEMVRDLDCKPRSLVDLGCGKAYLTFALYHYFQNILGVPIEVTGVDIKEDVLEKCSAIAKKLGFSSLFFAKGSIQGYTPEKPPEMVVALHACNVASDHAIDQAIKWQAKAILVAPCCQHQLYQTLEKKDFPPVFKHNLLKERYAALLTDALRAEKLENAGYKVQVIEFIDPEHTPKNLLIRAQKK